MRKLSDERRATARGRYVYAIAAPIVVDAAERILDGRYNASGIGASGQLFDAEDFLRALAPDPSSIELSSIVRYGLDVLRTRPGVKTTREPDRLRR